MTSPELAVIPTESNQALFVDFVARIANTQSDISVRYGSEPLKGTACVLVGKVVDVGREAEQAYVDAEFRPLFPVLYTLSVLRIEGTGPEVEVASMTVSDGIDGYIVIREEGQELIEEDGLRPEKVEELVSQFMMRNGIFHHIKEV